MKRIMLVVVLAVAMNVQAQTVPLQYDAETFLAVLLDPDDLFSDWCASNGIAMVGASSGPTNEGPYIDVNLLTDTISVTGMTAGASFTGIVAGAYLTGSGIAAIPVNVTGLTDHAVYVGATNSIMTWLASVGASNASLSTWVGSVGASNVSTATWLASVGASNTSDNVWLASVGSSQAVVRTYVDAVSNMVVLASNNAASVAGLLATSNNAASIGYANAISNIYVNAHLWTGTVSICTTTGLQNFATATFNTLAWDSSASSYHGNIISNKWYRPPSAGKYLACYSIIATNFPIVTSRKDIIHGLAVGGSSSFIAPVRDTSFPFAVAVTDFKYFHGSTILNLTTNDLVSVTIYNGGAPATSVWGPASTGYSGGRYFQIGRIE